MSEHKQEGDLRAWLDSELPPAEVASVTTHLNECAACVALRDELFARASRVANAMSILALTEMPVQFTAPVIAMRPVRSIWRWAMPVAALAASLLIAMFLWSKHSSVPAPAPDRAVVRTVPSRVPSRVPATPVVVEAKFQKPRIARTGQPEKSETETFMALDDEPIETGMVVRVSTESGDVQADVIVGPDGRAHAIRILNSGTDF